MMYRAVIFDLDGTLVDSSEGIIRATEESLRILGYPAMSHDDIRSCIGPPIGNSIIERNGLGKDELAKFNTVFRDLYKNKYLMDVSVYPSIMDLLRDLGKHHFIGIATNKRIDYTETLLKNLGIADHCDTVEGLDMEETLSKEDLVLRCIGSSGAKTCEIIMVGDTLSDSSAAERCGIDFVGVTFGFGFKTAGDVKYGRAADSVQELRELLFD